MNHLANVLLISLAACTATTEDAALTIHVQDAERVAGTYQSGDVAVAFDFSRQGDHHVLAFHGADGRPLITTTLDGAYQTTDVLGGKLVASGIANAPHPTIEGDRDAMRELHELPEAGLLEGLAEALVEAGVDEALYTPDPPEVPSVYNYDGRYFLFQTWDRWDFLSAAGPSPTYIYVKNPWAPTGACAAVTLQPWSGYHWEYIVAHKSNYPYSKAVSWWGSIFTVNNQSFPGWWGPYYCQPAQVLVRVSPYVWSP